MPERPTTPPAAPAPAPRFSLEEVDALATRAEQRLHLWFDVVESEPPTSAQLAEVSQAIWRLTAVRKTLILATLNPTLTAPRGRKQKDESKAFFRNLNDHISALELALSKFLAPYPKTPAKKTGPRVAPDPGSNTKLRP